MIRSCAGWQHLNRACQQHERRIGDERILGDSRFVEKALRQDALRIEAREQIRRAGWDLDILIQAFCDYFQVDTARVNRKSRQKELSFARPVICYLGVRRPEQSAVSMASNRGGMICGDKRLTLEILENIGLSD